MKFFRAAPFLVLAFGLVWYAALALRFHSHGAIGDDPATYVQMALDLAQRSTLVHDFPLFNNFFDRGLSWDAFITPGYHIVRETGLVAPNFAFGFPMVLALGYRVFGESALYWATPLLGALSLVATFALANELFRDLSPTRRDWIGALAVLLLATSPKQIQLSLVPMSDVPTQLFCMFALWCALRAVRRDRFLARPRSVERNVADHAPAPNDAPAWKPVTSLAYAALCGLSLGIAYLIRHSAPIIIIPLALVAVRWGSSKREQIFSITLALFIFVITISPDLIYRANVLGSPFAVESPESAQVNFYDAPRQFLQMLAALVSLTGIGPVILLAPFGWWILWRENNKWIAAILIAWMLAFMLFHAPLVLTGAFENNLRYLLPAYPAIAICIAIGIVRLSEWAWRAFRPRRKPYQIRIKPNRWEIALLGAVASFLLLAISLRALANPERFVLRSYGWMSETARADMNALNEQLPRDAVIGVSDQMAGATLLYTQREIFRPANFLGPAREFAQLLQQMKNENRGVFLLGDWNCAGDASERLPEWVGDYAPEELKLEIRDLPYECAQQVRHLE